MRLFVSSVVVLLMLGCAQAPDSQPTVVSKLSDSAPVVAYHPQRAAFFGDLHVHTMYSFDAFVFGTRATPDDAYRYAQGEALTHPAGFPMQLTRPLDFQAVTDHAIYLGMVPAMNDASSPVGQHPLAVAMRQAQTPAERGKTFLDLVAYLRKRGDDDLLDMAIVRSAWQDTVDAAQRHYRPGEFTSFIAYEFSATRSGDTLHRNVIFRGSRAPDQPFSARDAASNPENLWDWMDEQRADGVEALAIPHNSNISNGQAFELVNWAGRPLSEADGQRRRRNEPLLEITQVKGSSETHPALSPNDEWANFEIDPYRTRSSELTRPSGSYARDALLKGLFFEDKGRSNPFEYGFIGSSDTHVAAGSFDESNYWSKVGNIDATPALRGSVPQAVAEGGQPEYAKTGFQRWGASGLAGVWAVSNTREAIFDALRRRETFATSGPRIRLRFFAGRDFPAGLAGQPGLIKTAYARGVPMGSSLTSGEAAPEFLAWAMRDPEAAPLQRLQIVKGWTDGSGAHEKVYDVACSDGLVVDPASHRCPDNGARVNLKDCSISAKVGAGELKALWRDPDYQSGQRAFYYLRALENPTCRWSTWDALREGVAPREGLPATLQERAWSSPIWIRPRPKPVKS